jgi:hypothetical protein
MPDFGKDWRPIRSPEASAKFAERVDELREALLLLDPNLVAARSGAAYLTLGLGRGELHIPFWGNVCILSWPELSGYGHLIEPQPLTDFQLAFLFHHLLTADGMPVSGKWVSFADLPDGRVYNAAFQGYSGDELVKAFGSDLNAFHKACQSAGGQPADLASASYVFQPLPHVPLMVTYWLGDEDFPSSCKILFDESASHYLPIDGCAILGSMLVRKLLAAT